jgi:hypothetical protein
LFALFCNPDDPRWFGMKGPPAIVGDIDIPVGLKHEKDV